jgi:hypothetical protein
MTGDHPVRLAAARRNARRPPPWPVGEEQSGDFVLLDVQRPGEPPGPGRVAIGDGLLVEAWCTSCGPIATREYDVPSRADVLGFTRSLEHPDVRAQVEARG